jgi:transcription factor S
MKKMAMLFCPKCGSLLRPKVDGKKKKLFCSCGYSSNEIDNATIKEEVIKTDTARVEVVHKDIETMPLVDMQCPKCKHPKSYFWEIQTRAADEPATKFYKCEKCKHIWRDYS